MHCATAERNLRVTLDSIGDAVIATNSNGIITRINPVAERLTGWPFRDTVGKHFPDVFRIINEEAHAPAENPAVKILDNNSATGETIGMILVFRDITEHKLAETKIKTSLAEKEILLKEVHHRVKNNLQIISSLISLQTDSLANEQLTWALGDVRDRLRTMALVHEKLYQTNDLSRLDFAEYAPSLLNYLWSAHGATTGNVHLSMAFASLILPIELAVPCGLILNELASNALKHAFPSGMEGEVTVTLEHDHATGAVCLRVRDNSIGLPADLDWRQSSSLGLRIVQMLVGQIRGTVQTGQSPGPGTEFRIKFNVNRSPS